MKPKYAPTTTPSAAGAQAQEPTPGRPRQVTMEMNGQ